MPATRRTLSVGHQNGVVMVWALVDPAAKREKVKFKIVGTGHRVVGIDGWRFVGTVQLPPYVWHVFCEMPTNNGF